MQREFTVACDDDETEGLMRAAAYLDKQMKDISMSGQVLSIDRCAIMAGLNVSHALLQLQQTLGLQENVNSRIESLHTKIDKAVSRFE